MAGYSSRVRTMRPMGGSGLIDRKTAEAIVRDVEAHERRSLSFGAVLAIMAALLFGAAILVFVAVKLGDNSPPPPGRRALRDHIRGLCRRRGAEDSATTPRSARQSS